MGEHPIQMSSYMRDVFQAIGTDWAPIAYGGRRVFSPTIAALKARGLIETEAGGDAGHLWRLTEAGEAEQQLYRETFGRG